MSETAKHGDIEDVLSSIRRLVSDGAGIERETPPPAAERLVLTPALRVADADGVFGQVQPVAEQGAGAPAASAAPASESGSDTDTAPEDPSGETFINDETSPDRPVGALTGNEGDGAATPGRGDLPFGLSSFTGGAVFGADEPRDVLQFRGADTAPEPMPEPLETDSAPVPDAAEPTADATESTPEMADADGAAELDWPEPDSALDAADWAEDPAEEWTEEPVEAAQEQSQDVDPAPAEAEAVAPEPGAAPEPAMPETEEDQDADQGDAWDAAKAALEAAQQGDPAEPEEEPRPDGLRPDLARLEFPSEPAFEPEHGDTDWSETESVQPALDIAAVRHARGEAPEPQTTDPQSLEPGTLESPEPDEPGPEDTAPPAMPIFARSRRRPMTSLDDLITPEGSEPDTVADAVSQAMADNALERQEAAAETVGQGIADESFDVDGDGGSDLGLIDEEALRDLIAQVVREELQGVLGQRITRNVRKMVRREIRLALAAEEFD